MQLLHNVFLEKLEMNPIIAAVKNDEGLERALQTEVEIVFVLYGDVCSIPAITERIRGAGKLSMVHMDLISGLNNSREVSVDFIRRFTSADGIITTKSALVSRASELGLYSVLRFFILDSMAMESIEKQTRSGGAQPDVIEILPGVVSPRVMQRIKERIRVPLIAGGLIADREDVMNALKGGAVAVSSTNEQVWSL